MAQNGSTRRQFGVLTATAVIAATASAATTTSTADSCRGASGPRVPVNAPVAAFRSADRINSHSIDMRHSVGIAQRPWVSSR